MLLSSNRGSIMAHLFQVGVGSGGMAMLDLVAREERVRRVTLVDPDVYQSHNVVRHLFPVTAVGQPKVELARRWLLERRPDLEVGVLQADITDPLHQGALRELAEDADLGVCAADNEPAKYQWDALMRRHGTPWTLGEVLAGGIGGFVHCFVPGGPCYGCVASFLKRSVPVEKPAAPDYSAAGTGIPATTVPASRAAIQAVASLHALVTLELLAGDTPRFSSLLWTLGRVPGVFEEPFRPYRFRVSRAPDCLLCQAKPTPLSEEELDGALGQALARLSDS
jgi:molybdopterin/thiamine biosynthesis adenylyltransferase